MPKNPQSIPFGQRMGLTLPRCISYLQSMPVSKTEWTANRIQHYPDTRESLYLQSMPEEWSLKDRVDSWQDTALPRYQGVPANSLCLRGENSQSVLSEWTLKGSFQSELSKCPVRVNFQRVLSEWTLKGSFQSELSKGPFRVNPQSVLSEWILKRFFLSELSKCPFRVNPQSVLSEWTLKCPLHYHHHAPSIAFRHLPPNSACTGYATGGALFIRPIYHNLAPNNFKFWGEHKKVQLPVYHLAKNIVIC